MSNLSKSEQIELLKLIAKEWDEHPDYTFQDLIKEFTYMAVGHTELYAEDEHKLLNAFRVGWKHYE